jgi:hypothetical protein
VAVNLAQIIESQAVPATATTLYTAAAATRVQVTKLAVFNATAGAATYTLYLVPSGGAAGVTNEITPPTSVAAGATINDPNIPGMVLMPGDYIAIAASAAATLAVAASGTVFS